VIAHWRSLGSAPPNLTLLHADALAWLASTKFSSDTLIYCDPPYLMSTRSSHRRIYRCEMTDKDHKHLLEIIKGLPCLIMISGYLSEMYAQALHDWRTATFTTRTRGGKIATEWLWMNFQEPLELHDYRYLGKNFRERERIQRRTRRWKNRLLTMTPLERHAIMAAISEIRQS
jgi:DNA adenine methylase